MYNHGTPHTTTETTSTLTIVENKGTNIEREIDHHVKSIRALISKLRPAEKQKYFNGLLAFIVHDQIEWTETETKTGTDYSKLTSKDLTILEELSAKMQELYNTMEFDPE
jgi:hypothetical protein